MPVARTSAFIDDTTVLLPPQVALDTEAIYTIEGWVQALFCRRRAKHLTESSRTASSSGGVDTRSRSADQRVELERTLLTVAGRGREEGRGTDRNGRLSEGPSHGGSHGRGSRAVDDIGQNGGC